MNLGRPACPNAFEKQEMFWIIYKNGGIHKEFPRFVFEKLTASTSAVVISDSVTAAAE